MASSPKIPTIAGYRWPVAVAGALLSVYGWHVFQQYNLLSDIHQRELASAALELKRTVENAIVNVETTFSGADAPQGLDRLCEFDRDQPYIELIAEANTSCTDPITRFTSVSAAANGGIQIQADGIVSGTERKYNFRFLTGVLLQELAFPEAFEVLFVSNASGEVFHTDTPSRRRALSILRWGENRFRDSAADFEATLSIQRMADVLPDSADPGWKGLSAQSSRKTVTLSGHRYMAYVEPVSLGAGHEAEDQLALTGLVPFEDVVLQAMAIDTYFLAGMVFVLLLAVLGVPFVKLILLDSHERYHRKDAYFLCLSTGALLTLFTFGVLAIDSYLRWNDVANRGLRDYAANLEDKLLLELDAIQGQLREFDQKLAHEDPRNCEAWDLDRNWFVLGDRGALPPPALESVFIQQAAWLDSEGQQIWKATADIAGEKVKVSRRAYFRAIRDGNLYQSGKSQEPYFFAPDRSITDGKFYTFLSIPSHLPKGFCTDLAERGVEGKYTAVATATLLSLDRPPLPEGYGFAVINREGRTLYHSDPRRSLRENFFVETGDSDRLRGMVYSGMPYEITTSYRGRPHHVYLHPLSVHRQLAAPIGESGLSEGAGIYLALFRDLSPERASIAHVFVSNMSGPLIALLAIMGCALWIMARFEERRHQRGGAWLWPHEGSAGFYWTMMLVFSALLILSKQLYGTLSAWVAILTPLTAGTLAIVIYRAHLKAKPKRSPLRSRWPHVAQLSLLLVCMISIPCAIFVRITQHEEFGKTIEAGRLRTVEEREDVQLALRSEARTLGYSVAVADKKAQARRSLFVAGPAPFDLPTVAVHPNSTWLLAVHDWIERWLPIREENASLHRYQPNDTSYSPPVWLSWFAITGVIIVVVLLAVWIRWSTERLFLASIPGVQVPLEASQLPDLWDACTKEEKLVLIWAATEHFSNPRQRGTVTKLIQNGWLTLDPDLQPASPEIDGFLNKQAQAMNDEIRKWEQEGTGRSWSNWRPLFWLVLTSVALFLLATQPSLQSGLLAVSTAVTGLLTTLHTAYESIVSWISQRRGVSA